MSDCDACLTDQYQNQTGQAACLLCSSLPACPIGQYRAGCGGSSPGSCTPCTPVANEYFISGGGLADGCARSRCDAEVACATGSYRAGCEVNSPGFCTPCTNKDSTEYYTGHGQLSDACPKATCSHLTCTAGHVRTGSCGVDQNRSNDEYECTACLAGTFAATGAEATCELCPAGKFAPDPGSLECHNCTAGYLCVEGASAPQPCPGGKHADPGVLESVGFLSNLTSDCTVCGPGTLCPVGSAEPANCSAGTYNNASEQQTCTPCERGKYQSSPGATQCATCPVGSYSANVLSCEPCQVGEYCEEGATVGTRCPLVHSTTMGRGTRSEDECVCQVGYYLHSNDVGNSICLPCAKDGTDCTELGATVATLPLLVNWWRLPNSTRLERCFSISSCTGGRDAYDLCGDGYEGAFCGVCAEDFNGTRYHRSVGECVPCRGSIAPAALAFTIALIVLGVLLVALRKSERAKGLRSKIRSVSIMDVASKERADVLETEYELPDVSLPSIVETLRLRFPAQPWPNLPDVRLGKLGLPHFTPFTPAGAAASFPHVSPWPSAPNLAFLCNLLRVALPDLEWPALPDLDLPQWEWPEWVLPDVDASALLATLRERFPQHEWPNLPQIKLPDLTLPRLALPEFALYYPHLAPWPSTPNLAFLCNLLRIAFPDLSWPATPDLRLADWSLPEWAATWTLPDLDLSLSLFDGVLVKLRILVSMIQVLSQLGVVYSIPFPTLYANLLRWLGLLEFNLPEVLPLGCVVNFDFYSALLLRTLLLPVLGLVLVLMRFMGAPPKALDVFSGALFVILFLIYPSTSAAIFGTFQCEDLEDGTSWLRADLSIDCNSATHATYSFFASLMVIVYPIGTPTLYYFLLRRQKPRLDKLRVNQTLRVQLLEEVRAERDYSAARVSSYTRQVPWLVSKAERKALPMAVRRRLRKLEREDIKERKLLPPSVAKLIKGYELRVWWFEIFECFRKLAVACLPVFFRPSGSAEQLMYGLVVCFMCFGAYVHLDPFEDRGNDGIARLCQAQIFFSLLSSVALVFSSAGASLDVLLVLLWCLPVSMAVFLESPLLWAALALAERWRTQQEDEAGAAVERLGVKARALAKLGAATRSSTSATASKAAYTAPSPVVEQLSATFDDGPLGVTFREHRDGTVDIVAVEAGSQAARLGIIEGSKLLKVAGEPVESLGKEAILSLIHQATRPMTLVLSLEHGTSAAAEEPRRRNMLQVSLSGVKLSGGSVLSPRNEPSVTHTVPAQVEMANFAPEGSSTNTSAAPSKDESPQFSKTFSTTSSDGGAAISPVAVDAIPDAAAAIAPASAPISTVVPAPAPGKSMGTSSAIVRKMRRVPEPARMVAITFGPGPLGMGIGQRGDVVKVTSVDDGSQASAKGVVVGSVILQVAGESVKGLGKHEVLERVKDATRPVNLLLQVEANERPDSN